MKKLIFQVIVTMVFAAVLTALNVWALLSLNPVEYYFTLPGFIVVGILEAIECALLSPIAIEFTKRDRMLNDALWVKKES